MNGKRRREKQKRHISAGGRIQWVLLFFFVAFGALLVRVFMLGVVNHRFYLDLAAKQHRDIKEIFPQRGTIFAQDKDKNRIPLAINRVYKNIAIIPSRVENADEVVDFLSTRFGASPDDIKAKIAKKDDPYELIVKKLNPDSVQEAEQQKIAGVLFEEEKRRTYPHNTIGAHIIGFVSKEKDEEIGKYGLERIFQKELSGQKGIMDAARSANNFWAALGNQIVRPSRNGSDLLLTMDYNIQVRAEDILTKTVEKWQAASGEVLVIDPASGRILALAARPDFDPNEYSKEKNFAVFLNPAVESMYELGSVLKPLTMAAALEEKKVTPEKTYQDSGAIKIGGYTIKNFDERAYGTQTMAQVIEKSLNTGMVFVARLVGKEKQYEYFERFGLGQKTGIDLPGEISGDIRNLGAGSGRDITFATASFGQGIAVTPIQLASAIGAIANKGIMMRPYAVDEILDGSGNEIKKEPRQIRRVISPESAEQMTKMLVSAVQNGFENRARIKGYFVAGKTGTAQMPRSDGKGYSEDVVHTFVGYAPAFNPKFLILIQLNKPKGNRFAANTLTPAFHDLAEFILNYYEVPPDER